VADLVQRAPARSSPSSAAAITSSTPRVRRRQPSGAAQQLVLADLGLPAADVAAPALLRAAAVDEQVPDLTGVAARPESGTPPTRNPPPMPTLPLR
jgi:hypothetical protein